MIRNAQQSSFGRRLLSRDVPFPLALAAAALLFLILASLGAVTDGWFTDEYFTWDIIQHDLSTILRRTIDADVHPPLYYLTLAVWHKILPLPSGMQLFSMAMGLGAVLSAGAIGFLIRGRRLGILAALLWATFPFLLHASQEGRMYAMALFLETLAVAGWALGQHRPRPGWLLFVAALTASLYTQNLCLIFAAALIGGEVMRCLFALRRPLVTRQGTGLAWILSAALAIGGCYVPWIFALRHQLHSALLPFFYQPPSWNEVAEKLLAFSYSVKFNRPEKVWDWMPGLIVLGLLPCLWLAGRLRCRMRNTADRPHDQRPVAMLLWIFLAPYFFLVLYSQFIKPIFVLDRHGIMFVPFLLFPAAAALESFGRRAAGRLAALALIAGCGYLALVVMSRSRDTDLRPAIAAIMDRAPVVAPVVVYPALGEASRPMWKPLPSLKNEEMGGSLEKMTSCTLVINMSHIAEREDIKRRSKRTIAQATDVRKIFVSYGISAYFLKGLPPGALAALLRNKAGMGFDAVAQQVGRWLPVKAWNAGDLSRMVQPASNPIHLSQSFPAWMGVRLTQAETIVNLPLAEFGTERFGVMMAGGYLISNGKGATLGNRLKGRLLEELTPSDGDFLIARIDSMPVENTNGC